MNFVFPFVIILSFISSAFFGNLETTVTSGIDGAKSAIETALSLAGILCFWSGILNVAEKGGAAKCVEKWLSPIISKLFPKTSAKSSITMNVIANLFGTGNAATQAGISAMEKLDEENNFSEYPSHQMCRFTVMNTASIGLFPTTVISILASCGSKNPFSIVPPVWICSFLSLSAALFAEMIFCKRGEKK